ncbi:Alpha-L-arabinofuranosidase II precursor [Acidisarcina polymorpha]|uniref:Alpha-L-arabinofuranosidase II n=1 Tax=Acidisarcina polymorpha TaxID=2211140 RepID=A0A2Z5G799_9BACT|nr:glycosyl hydrolase [Acidisarcina polymorpha]AXC14951.1 Alpha-L-arabinofuranosidase II precursor [Acidisarcina polymorpha]
MAFALLCGATSLMAQQAITSSSSTSLEDNFKTPPDSAKPRVWWHWMSGNVTQAGITADLEWMHRVGIGGMQMFDGDLGVPHYMKPVIWMTPEWKAAMQHAAGEADRLHLEMSMAASGGWSETAGPWVKPSEAMKKAVWSETEVHGPQAFSGKLAEPPRVNGPFQGLVTTEQPMAPHLGGAPATYTPPPAPEAAPDPTYYADSVVLAYRLPAREAPAFEKQAKITSSDPALNPAALSDGDYSTTADLGSDADGSDAWIQWEFPQNFTLRSFTLGMGLPPIRGFPALPNGRFSSSTDGEHWTDVVALPDTPTWIRPFSVRTFSFAPITARYFRVTLQQPKLTEDQVRRGMSVPKLFRIAELRLYSSPRVNFFEDKASFGTFVATANTATPMVAKEDAIPVQDVVDLTSKMRADGTLDWQVPAGNWVILRMGYSLTGKKNHPATPEATGYEVDKLSRSHVADYVKTYTGMISGAVSPYYSKSFRYFLMDSWEAGQENWTESILTEFRNRRGYDPIPWLPVLCGRIVESSEASDGFLWDYRLTLSELLAENHYKLANDFLAKQGLGLYAEAMGIYMPTTGDGLLNKGQVSIPMGEFWTPMPDQLDLPTREADVREASSAGHIYGKPIIATESFTSNPTTLGWAQTPFYLKQLADQNFARGVNRIVFHTSDHQPFVDGKHKPGITLGYYGQHYTRNITWAEQAVAWNGYLARCSYLLQQGKPVVDVAYFYGEGAPVTVPFWKHFSPAVPVSASYDYLNSDVLLHQTSVSGGKLTLKSGMTYRVLVVPDEMTALSLPVVRQLTMLVKAGAVVVAPRMAGSPSLSDLHESAELHSLVNTLWGAEASASGSHSYGKGKVYWGTSLERVFTEQGIQPDFTSAAPKILSSYSYPVPNATDELVWAHRRTPEANLYFVANQMVRTEEVETSYRVAGKAPELWYPDTGKTEPVSYRVRDGHTLITLRLSPEGSVFVIFRSSTNEPARTVPATTETELATLPGPWKVAFPPDLGAPPVLELPSLTSWTSSADPGVKYFSGTATYSQDFNVDRDWFPAGSSVVLDLGRVREIAEVSVNGTPVGGVLWKPPFRVNLSPLLKAGVNHLEVKVTNLWPNRLIGDQQPDATAHYTFTDYQAYEKDSPLTESGLLGPVRLIGERTTTRQTVSGN